MKVGLFFLLQVPRPWDSESDFRTFHEALDQIELADSLGFHHAWSVEHHFLEEYSHSASPELFLAAAAMRTKRIRLGHGIVQLQPQINHPVRVAERIAVLDVLSKGRVDFGTGEGSGALEIGAFGVDLEVKHAQWEESLRSIVRMFSEQPFEGIDGRFLNVPRRNIVPKPMQTPHPPLWMAAPRPEPILNAARKGMGALCFTTNVEPESAARIVQNYEAEVLSDRFMPISEVVTPRVACVTPFMCHHDERTAIERGLDGAHFMGFAQGYFYQNGGSHDCGNVNLWERFERERTQAGFDRKIASASIDALGARVKGENGTAVVRGAIGSTTQIRDFLRRFEAGGVDEVIFIAQAGKTRHEHIMESIEIFGREVLPEFIDRDVATERAREDRLGAAIEAGLARRAQLDPAGSAAPSIAALA
jgi:alkanesulfonate monooxygenase SsuD/methylene tetrahydromethanopterin reductase-like flavin-dependent oxidoreductase (luciferase family)